MESPDRYASNPQASHLVISLPNFQMILQTAGVLEYLKKVTEIFYNSES